MYFIIKGSVFFPRFLRFVFIRILNFSTNKSISTRSQYVFDTTASSCSSAPVCIYRVYCYYRVYYIVSLKTVRTILHIHHHHVYVYIHVLRCFYTCPANANFPIDRNRRPRARPCVYGPGFFLRPRPENFSLQARPRKHTLHTYRACSECACLRTHTHARTRSLWKR